MNKHNIKYHHLLCLVVLILAYLSKVESISIPVQRNQARCMVIYSMSDDQSVKIDLRFPALQKNQADQQQFNVWINNTQTNEVEYNVVKPGGTFRRQMQLTPNVMYHLCFSLIDNSQIMGFVNVQYESYHLYRITNNNRHNLKVPDSILKQNELKSTYDDALFLLDLTERQLALNSNHKKDQGNIYKSITFITGYLVFISWFQLGFILVAAALQFYVLKKHLNDQLRL